MLCWWGRNRQNLEFKERTGRDQIPYLGIQHRR